MAINEKSEKFWYGVNDKVTNKLWRVRGKMGAYRKFGLVWRSTNGGGIGEFLVVGTSVGKYGRSGKVWGEEWRCVEEV